VGYDNARILNNKEMKEGSRVIGIGGRDTKLQEKIHKDFHCLIVEIAV
jgi:hypothetical protein